MNPPFTFNTLAVFFGVSALLYAVVQLFVLLNMYRKGIKVTATIIDFKLAVSTKGLNTYFPVLEYKTEDGQTIAKQGYIGIPKDRQKLGDKVDIIYNPDRPAQFLLGKGIDKYGKLLGALIFGVVFIAAGLLRLF